jgi:hypothetical protein
MGYYDTDYWIFERDVKGRNTLDEDSKPFTRGFLDQYKRDEKEGEIGILENKIQFNRLPFETLKKD